MFKWFEKKINPFPDEMIATPSQSFFPFAWSCTKGLRKYIFFMSLFTALIAGFEAILYGVLGKLIDTMTTLGPSNYIHDNKILLLTLASVLILSTLFVCAQSLLKHQALAGPFPMRLRWNFHRLLLNQSLDFYNNEFSGRIATKVMQTALAIRDMWFILTDILTYVIVYFATMVVVVGSLDRLLMLPFLIWLLVYTINLIYFIPKLAKLSKNQADARSSMTGRITDAYTNINIVKLFSHAGRESEYAKYSMRSFLDSVNLQMRKVSAIEVINHLLSMLLIIGTSSLAIGLWSQEVIGIGVVATACAMSLRLSGISHWVMWEMTTLYEQIGTAQDGLNMLSKQQTIYDSSDAKKLMIKKSPISFRNITFAYPNHPPLFTNFSLNINHGEKVGLVGRSGAGKSSLVNLLLRFYEPMQGEILVGNFNINSLTQNSLREHIAMVTQDTSLLHRSIKENIAYSRPNATNQEIILAAKKAQAHEFIKSLRDQYGNSGYNSLVGERGVKLSGGQRQRIAIARVILKNAPILLLDEATSALDSEIEQIIQDSLDTVMTGKTVIAIAHRLSTIAAMDRLIVIDKGKIIEEGSHQKLVMMNGLYYELWKRQSGGFIAEQ